MSKLSFSARTAFSRTRSPARYGLTTPRIRPDVAVELAATALDAGLRPLDAPVSGGEAGAIEGMLSIMVGGEPADFEAAKPVLEAVGKTIVLVGPSGSGQTVKAANQLIVAANIQALSEAVVFLEAYGVDTDAAIKVLWRGTGRLQGPGPEGRTRILDREFAPGFRLALHNKDMGIVTSAAREAGVVLPLGRTGRAAGHLHRSQWRRGIGVQASSAACSAWPERFG